MSGVGFWELVVLFVIGLLILGPERLPRVATQIGRWVGRARRTANQLRFQLEREIALADIEKKSPPKKETKPPPPAGDETDSTPHTGESGDSGPSTDAAEPPKSEESIAGPRPARDDDDQPIQEKVD